MHVLYACGLFNGAGSSKSSQPGPGSPDSVPQAATMSCFCVDFGNLNSGPHVYGERALSMKPLPLPWLVYVHSTRLTFFIGLRYVMRIHYTHFLPIFNSSRILKTTNSTISQNYFFLFQNDSQYIGTMWKSWSRQAQRYTHVIPASRAGGRGSEAQGHPWINRDLKDGLEPMKEKRHEQNIKSHKQKHFIFQNLSKITSNEIHRKQRLFKENGLFF